MVLLAKEKFKTKNYSYLYNRNILNSTSELFVHCNDCDSDFITTITKHIICGYGCRNCGGNEKHTLKLVIEKSNKKHGYGHYSFDLVDENLILNKKSKIPIICLWHCGYTFTQSIDSHLQGKGCYLCGDDKRLLYLDSIRITYDKIIEMSAKVHKVGLYSYDLIKNLTCKLNTKTKIPIICNSCNGYIFNQEIKSHLQLKTGCPKCINRISKPEIEWLNFLNIKEENRQINLPRLNKKYQVVDDPLTNTVYEFHGDYWHGNPNIFKNEDINKKSKKTFGEIYKKTINRENEIKNAGYNLVVMWESEWNLIKKTLKVEI